MRKAGKYIKNNSYIIYEALMFLFFIVLFQFLFLNPQNDDYIYSIPSKASMSDFFYFMKYHYSYCNSRIFVHSVLLFLLRFDVYVWRIFIPICFCLIPVLTLRLLTDDLVLRRKLAPILVLAMFSVSSAFYAEMFFWVTGSVNYILPATLILLNLLCIKKNKCFAFQLLLSLLCGASTEQYGIISLVAIAMILIYRIVNKKGKIGILIADLVLCLIGLLTVVCAPAVKNRLYADSTPFIYKFENMFMNIWFNCKGMTTFIAFLITVLSCVLVLYYKKKIRIVAIVFSGALIALFAASKFELGKISTLSLLVYPLFLISGMIVIAIQAAIKKYYVPMCSLLLGGGAQFMMIFTQRSSFRTTAPSIFCFIIFSASIICFVMKYSNNKTSSLKTAFIPVLAVLVAVASINIYGYVKFAENEYNLSKSGERAEVIVDEKQNRDDVDKVIEAIEKVRLDNMEYFNSLNK